MYKRLLGIGRPNKQIWFHGPEKPDFFLGGPLKSTERLYTRWDIELSEKKTNFCYSPLAKRVASGKYSGS